jgi:hypothetical protein
MNWWKRFQEWRFERAFKKWCIKLSKESPDAQMLNVMAERATVTADCFRHLMDDEWKHLMDDYTFEKNLAKMRREYFKVCYWER